MTQKRKSSIISVSSYLRKGKCPGIYAVTHSNETHDVLFQLKYHIHNYNYSYYLGRGVLEMLNMTEMHDPSLYNHTEVYYLGCCGFYISFS